MFKVEKGIPIQGVSRSKSSKYAEFLQELPVGASFSQTEDGKPITASRVNVVRHYAKRVGIKVCSRRIGDDAYRVWRVADKGKSQKKRK